MTFKEHFQKKLRYSLEAPESRYVDNSLKYYQSHDPAAQNTDIDFFATAETPSFEAFAAENRKNLKLWETLLSETYELLGDAFSKEILVTIACYRILGHRYVKFPYYTRENYERRTRLAQQARDTDCTDGTETIRKMLEGNEFGVGFTLGRYDLATLGHTGKIYTTSEFIYNIAYSNCYRYDHSGIVIDTLPGDCVFDCGACFGDTSIFFALKAGAKGRVFSLEPHPVIALLQRLNIEQNAHLRDRIIPVKRAAWNAVGETLSFSLSGPGSTATLELGARQKVDVVTTTIDYETASRALKKVDFIKMDIEGAEYNALLGALGTITAHRPRLAISVYHSLEDFYRIPQLIHELGLGYTLFLDHHYVNEWESVLYALPPER